MFFRFLDWIKKKLYIISFDGFVLIEKDSYWTLCARCKKPIVKESSEICWYCLGDLCLKCWDEFGHCGHKEAEAANEYARNFDPDNPPNPLPRIPMKPGG